MMDISAFITRNSVENYSLRFMNAQTDFVAGMIFPELPVKKKAVKVWQYDNSHIKEVETRADSKSESNAVEYGGFFTDVNLESHKLHNDIDPADERDADEVTGDLREDGADVILQKLLIKRERLAATLVETTGNYPADLTASLSAGDTWLDSGGDPEEDAMTAANAVKARCGMVPNAVQMSGNSLRLLRTSPALRERMKYTSGGPISDEAIKAFLGVKYLFVGDAQYDSAPKGATSSIGQIWSDGALFFVHSPTIGKKTMCFGKTAILNRLWSYEYEDPKRGSGAGRMKVLELGWDYKMVPGFVVSSSDTDFAAGYYLDNIV